MVYRYTVPPAWYEGCYQDTKAPCKAARSFSLLHKEKSSKAVLLIHGYAGYPGELVRPARDLYELGYDIFVPRLPGCGTTGENFMKARRSDWIKLASNAAKDLRARYDDFSILGHSMGSALTIIAASVSSPDKVVTAAPAVKYDGLKPPKPLWQIYLFSLLKKRIPVSWHHQSEYVLYYEDAPNDDDYLGGEYWSWAYLRQLYELYKLMGDAAAALPSLDMPLLAISTGKDALVGTRPAEEIVKAKPETRKLVHIEECTHFLFYDPDKSGEEKAVEAVKDFLLL